MILSILPRRGTVVRGPRIPALTLASARAVGSLPRFQAQVADISSALDNNTNRIPPILNTIPGPEAVAPPVHPVATALPQDRDEFWRKVPLWRDVSAKEFLSYSWSVSWAAPEG
jgi:lysine 2,3-aminomutase